MWRRLIGSRAYCTRGHRVLLDGGGLVGLGRMDQTQHPRRPRWRAACAVSALLFAVLAAVGARGLFRVLGGESERLAVRGETGLSPDTASWLKARMAPLGEGPLVDVHAHLGGTGNGSDCWINPRLKSPLHPRDWVRMRIYASAASVGPEEPDRHWSERMEELARTLPIASKHVFLAFDYRYRRDGSLDLEHSEFHVPNDWTRDEARRQGRRFAWAASVHPYRKDAIQELERCFANGARMVKWIPAAQGIDPADDACVPFYRAAKRLGMALLIHVGDEQAVETEKDRELGNPLRLRKPLTLGVRVIAAHCGSLGLSPDWESAGEPRVPSFDLFLRLLDDPLYEGRLFGDISALTQVNRFGGVLATMLERRDLHRRLINGSDWPLPNVNVLYRLGPLAAAGFLAKEDLGPLQEIYAWNPLLFDLALKLAVRSPANQQGFAPEVFLPRAGLEFWGR